MLAARIPGCPLMLAARITRALGACIPGPQGPFNACSGCLQQLLEATAGEQVQLLYISKRWPPFKACWPIR